MTSRLDFTHKSESVKTKRNAKRKSAKNSCQCLFFILVHHMFSYRYYTVHLSLHSYTRAFDFCRSDSKKKILDTRERVSLFFPDISVLPVIFFLCSLVSEEREHTIKNWNPVCVFLLVCIIIIIIITLKVCQCVASPSLFVFLS